CSFSVDLYVLRVRLLPYSLLFPYTTLFRSMTDPANYYWAAGMDMTQDNVGDERSARLDMNYRIESGWLQSLRAGVRATDRNATKDRKSTRLNSSHVKISYAVFCLKQKNKTV